MYGNLGDPNRKPWNETYVDGQKVQTLYHGSWHKGIVTGKHHDLLKVTVLDDKGEVLFKDCVTTKDTVKAS